MAKKPGKSGRSSVSLLSVNALSAAFEKGVGELTRGGSKMPAKGGSTKKGTTSPGLPLKGGGSYRGAASGRFLTSAEVAHRPKTTASETRHAASKDITRIRRLTRELVRKELGDADNVVAIRSKDPLVTRTVADVVERVAEIVEFRREALTQANIDTLVDAYLKSEPTIPARHEIELDNARERVRFLETYACYTSKEVAKLAGHEAANASATTTRWKKAGKIFGLPFKDGELYPAFQFVDGQPRFIIELLLGIFDGERTPWQIAFWIVSSNSWLDGEAPADLLAKDPDAVFAAAAEEAGVVLG